MPEVKPAEFKDAMLRLRNGNPDAFEKFLSLFNDYYQDLLEKTMQSSNEEVLGAQGRAQTAYALLRLFKECTVEPKKPLPTGAIPIPQAHIGVTHAPDRRNPSN